MSNSAGEGATDKKIQTGLKHACAQENMCAQHSTLRVYILVCKAQKSVLCTGVQFERNVNIPPTPPHAMMCMTDTNVKKTCKYNTKLQSAANTTRNRAQTLKNRGVVNDAASVNKGVKKIYT